MEQIKRQTAYKVWLKDIVYGKYVRQQGEWEPNFININSINVSRVNVIATIVFTHVTDDNSYCSLTLDDGSSTIRVKSWREDVNIANKFKVGDLVNVIGKIKEYTGEIYISPEIISLIDDPNWELYRKLELLKEYGKPSQLDTSNMATTQSSISESSESNLKQQNVTEEVIVEEIQEPQTETDRQKVINLIEKLATEDGSNKESIIEQSPLDKEKTEQLILILLKEGEIYENKPGFLKVL